MTGTYLIALAMVGAIVLAALLFTMQAKRMVAKRKAEVRQVFEKLIADNQLTINHKNEETSMILAIDELRMVLLYIKHNTERLCRKLIPLAEVTHCTVQQIGNRITRTGKNGTETVEDNIDEIRLVFTFIDNTTADISIYKEAHDGLYEKLRLAEIAKKWQAHIQETLISGLRARA